MIYWGKFFRRFVWVNEALFGVQRFSFGRFLEYIRFEVQVFLLKKLEPRIEFFKEKLKHRML
jgi:hypothetical protein